MTTVNVDKVKVRLLRINPRNLVPSLDNEKLTLNFGSADPDDIAESAGSLVWQYQISDTLSASLRYSFLERSSATAFYDMYQNILILGITKTF